MAYEPTNWAKGDVITSAKLNKLEQGVAGQILFATQEVQSSGYGAVLDKTWQEIHDADIRFVVMRSETGGNGMSNFHYVSLVTATYQYDNTYIVECLMNTIHSSASYQPLTFYANSPDDYPCYPPMESQ